MPRTDCTEAANARFFCVKRISSAVHARFVSISYNPSATALATTCLQIRL